jgi:hypothetical protein
MQLQDKVTLANWLRSGATLADVERADPIGIVGNVRFTENARRAFRLLWSWSAMRFASRAGAAQDRYCERCGYRALQRRIDRARRIAARLQE